MPERMRGFLGGALGGAVLVVVMLASLYVGAHGTDPQQEKWSLFGDGETPDTNWTLHGRMMAGYDRTNSRPRFVSTDATGQVNVTGAGTSGSQAVPQTPVTIACDDTGNQGFTANANDLRIEVTNESTTVDVFLLWGAATGANRATSAGWSWRLGSDAGSGTAESFITPQGLRVGGESVACDSSAAATVKLVAWRAQ